MENTPEKGPGGIRASVDWATLSGPGSQIERARALIERHLGEVLETRPAGGHFRRVAWSFSLGVKIAFGEPDRKGKRSPVPDSETHVLVIIPGEACQALGDDLIGILGELARSGFHATRLDAAIDFHDGIGAHLPEAVAQAGEAGEIIRNPQWRDDRSQKGGRLTGRTVYVGTRSSRFMLRCYDRGLKEAPLTATPGEWVRWEVQHNNEGSAAQQFFLELVQSKPGQLVRTIAAAALGAFDFREASPYESDRHVRHRPRLAWFFELCDMFGRMVHRAVRKLPTAEGTRRHLINAVRMLNTIATTMGGTLDQAVDFLGQAAKGNAPRRPGTGLDSIVFRMRIEGVAS